MNRRNFLSALFTTAAGLVLPWEPRRVYSMPSAEWLARRQWAWDTYDEHIRGNVHMWGAALVTETAAGAAARYDMFGYLESRPDLRLKNYEVGADGLLWFSVQSAPVEKIGFRLAEVPE